MGLIAPAVSPRTWNESLTPLDVTTLLISLKVGIWATLMVVVTATPMAWMMARGRFPGMFIVDGLLMAPLVLPPTVTGYVLLYLLGAQSPLKGVMESLWGDTLLFTQTASVLAAAVVAFPLMYKTAKGAFEQIDPLALDAAVTFGARPWQLFRTIGCSQALPGLAGGMTMAFGRAMGEFGATLLVGGNIEGRTTTIPIAIYGAIETGDMTKAGLWSLVLGALAVATAVVGQYILQRGVVTRFKNSNG